MSVHTEKMIWSKHHVELAIVSETLFLGKENERSRIKEYQRRWKRLENTVMLLAGVLHVYIWAITTIAVVYIWIIMSLFQIITQSWLHEINSNTTDYMR